MELSARNYETAECVVLDFIDASFVSELLSPQAKASFTEKMLVVAAVWFLMGRKVSGHFSSLERKLDDMKEGLSEIASALRDVETKHDHRITAVEKKIEEMQEKK